jgi:hypothetical protein
MKERVSKEWRIGERVRIKDDAPSLYSGESATVCPPPTEACRLHADSDGTIVWVRPDARLANWDPIYYWPSHLKRLEVSVCAECNSVIDELDYLCEGCRCTA